MKNLKKKGFTIVELVIVIAVIAILSAVLIPTFSNLIRKANVSADTQLVKQLNQALAIEEVENGKNVTMHDALETVKEYGFDIAKINAKANLNEILWDSKNNIFVYFDADADKIVYIPNAEPDDKGEGAELWKIYNDEDELTEQTYSIYWNKAEAFIGDLTVGFDAGTTEGNQITYKGENNVTLRTNGGKVTVDAPQATVNHYGLADEVYVEQVSANTYNLYGEVEYMEVKAGQHVVLAEGSSVNGVFVDDADKSNVEIKNGQTNAVKSNTEVSKDQLLDSATKFAGGLGTQAEPYLIKTAEHMKNITEKYDSYNYFKVANGVEVINCENWTSVKLNGCFDGNGVLFDKLDKVLFINAYAYKNDDYVECLIENFSVNANISISGQSAAIVRSAGPVIKFKNINITGKIEGNYVGSFFTFGAGQYESDASHNPTVAGNYTFENCESSATLICNSVKEGTAGGFIVHPYGAKGTTITIKDSKYNGKMYVFKGKKARYISAMDATNVIFEYSEGYEPGEYTIINENSTNSHNFDYVGANLQLLEGSDHGQLNNYDSIVIDAVNNSSYAIATLFIAPNPGALLYAAITENLEKDGDSFVTNQVRKYDITWGGNDKNVINGNNYEIGGKDQYTGINGAYIIINQYAADGTLLSSDYYQVSSKLGE